MRPMSAQFRKVMILMPIVLIDEGREDIRVSEPDTPNVFNGSERSSELFEDCRQVAVE